MRKEIGTLYVLETATPPPRYYEFTPGKLHNGLHNSDGSAPFSCFFRHFHPTLKNILYFCSVFHKRHNFICSYSHLNHHPDKGNEQNNLNVSGVRTKSASSP